MVSVLMPEDGREAVDERADSTGGKVPFKGRGEGVEERCEGEVGKGETVVDDKLVGRVEVMPLAISKLWENTKGKKGRGVINNNDYEKMGL